MEFDSWFPVGIHRGYNSHDDGLETLRPRNASGWETFYISNMKKWFILLLILLGNNAFSQSMMFDHLSISEGLSQSSATVILQAKNGMIWIGTADGLNKFDGYQFTVFKQIPNDKQSLSENYILSLYQSPDEKIWIGTNGGGLNVYDEKTGIFTVYKAESNQSTGLSGNVIRTITGDKKGTIWIGAENGICVFDPTKKMFSKLNLTVTETAENMYPDVRSLVYDSTGFLWSGTFGGGLYRINLTTLTVRHFSVSSGLTDDRIWSLFQDRNHVLWIGTFGGGISALDTDTEQFRIFKTTNNSAIFHGQRIRSIISGNGDELWIGSFGNGVYRFHSATENYSIIQNDPQNGNSLAGNQIYSLLIDHSGNLWIGTEAGGISKLDLKPAKFHLLRKTPNKPNSLSSNQIMSILESSDRKLWIGTYGGGLNRLDRESGIFKTYFNEPNNPNSLNDNTVLSLTENHNGDIWIGTNNGLALFNRRTETFTQFIGNKDRINSLSNNDIRAIYEDAHHILWIGTLGGGLNRFDPKTGQFTVYKNNPGDSLSLPNNSIWCLYPESDRYIWIGTSGGLSRFDTEKGVFYNFRNEPNNENSLSHNRVRSIYASGNDIYWIGTVAGFNRFDFKTKIFTHFFEKDGLPNGYIYGILPDSLGRLWLSTNKGLSRFDPSQMDLQPFKNYDENDGLQSNEFNGGSYFKGRDGVLYFGGINGLNYFNPNRSFDNPNKPNVVITSFQVLGDERIQRYNFDEQIEIKLRAKENVFTFEFAALDYTNPRKNQYRYQLEGFNEKWIYTTDRRYVSYTNLDPGHYVFRVSGSNNDGIWNETGISVAINVVPPFYKTWWFITGGLILILFGVYFAGKWVQTERVRQEKERMEVLRQVTISVLHEIRQPLQVLHGNIDLIKLMTQDDNPEVEIPVKKSSESVNRIKNYLQKMESLLEKSKFQIKRYTKDQSMLDLNDGADK